MGIVAFYMGHTVYVILVCRICRSNLDGGIPPPLPPKKRSSNRSYQLMDECFSSDNSLFASSLER